MLSDFALGGIKSGKQLAPTAASNELNPYERLSPSALSHSEDSQTRQDLRYWAMACAAGCGRPRSPPTARAPRCSIPHIPVVPWPLPPLELQETDLGYVLHEFRCRSARHSRRWGF